MNPSSRDTTDALESRRRQKLDYRVLVAAVVGNLLLLLPLLFDDAPVAPYFALLIVLLLAPPAVMGYTDQPYVVGVALGVLPAFTMAVVDNPLSVAYIDNMVKLGIVWSGLALPVAGVSFVFGVLTRERTLRGAHTRPLVWRTLVAFAISAVIIAVRTSTRLLDTGVLH